MSRDPLHGRHTGHLIRNLSINGVTGLPCEDVVSDLQGSKCWDFKGCLAFGHCPGMTSASVSQGSAASVRGVAQSQCLESRASVGGPSCTLRTWICRSVASLLGVGVWVSSSELVGREQPGECGQLCSWSEAWQAGKEAGSQSQHCPSLRLEGLPSALESSASPAPSRATEVATEQLPQAPF